MIIVNKKVGLLLRKLNKLVLTNYRNSHNIINFFHEDPEAKVLAYTRWNDKNERVIVVANFSDHALPQYHIPNFPLSEWREWISGTQVEATNQEIVINLPEYEAKIFVETQKF